MAKIRLNEQQLKRIIENATRDTLNRIMNEGAGIESYEDAFEAGYDGREIPRQNGDQPNYDEWIRRKRAYEKAGAAYDEKKKADMSGRNYDELRAHWNELDRLKRDRTSAAHAATDVRPGVVGAFQRGARKFNNLVGKGYKRASDGIDNFFHNKIGVELEE